MKACSSLLGKEQADTLVGKDNLTSIWKGQGRDKEAAHLMGKCVQLRTQVLGANHSSTLSSIEASNSWEFENLDCTSGPNLLRHMKNVNQINRRITIRPEGRERTATTQGWTVTPRPADLTRGR